MNRKPVVALSAALVAALAIASPARADVRTFPYTYQYATPDAGERELALWTDAESAQSLTNQLELEYGVTDHLAISGYVVAKDLNRLDALKLEGRYRFAEAGELPVDTAVYLEYEQTLAAGDAPALEGKLLLEKTLGSVILGSNLIAEKKFSSDPVEFGATLGAAYAFNDTLRAGLESRLDEGKLFAGPTASLAFGGTRLVGGVLFGANSAMQGRVILAQEF